MQAVSDSRHDSLAKEPAMSRRWFALIPLVVAIAASFASSTVEARGSRSPYIKTPFGLIPKSVYNAPYVQNPQKLQQYRQAEQKMQGQKGIGTTGRTNTTTRKK
jgi:hypothetical protein